MSTSGSVAWLEAKRQSRAARSASRSRRSARACRQLDRLRSAEAAAASSTVVSSSPRKNWIDSTSTAGSAGAWAARPSPAAAVITTATATTRTLRVAARGPNRMAAQSMGGSSRSSVAWSAPGRLVAKTTTATRWQATSATASARRPRPPRSSRSRWSDQASMSGATMTTPSAEPAHQTQ
jgi:hypothetical protein